MLYFFSKHVLYTRSILKWGQLKLYIVFFLVNDKKQENVA